MFIWKKKFIAAGSKNLTGSRTLIHVLRNLGHCVDYRKTCQVETAQAIKTEKIANDETILLFSHEMRRVLYQPFSGQITLM